MSFCEPFSGLPFATFAFWKSVPAPVPSPEPRGAPREGTIRPVKPASPLSEHVAALAAEPLRLRSILVFAACLLLLLWLHLLSALFAGLTGYVLYRRVRAFTGPAGGSWKKRALRWLIVSGAVAVMGLAVLAGFELLFNASQGGLGRLMQLLADTLDQIRAMAPPWVVERLPESADAVQHAISGWLRSHAGDVQRWSGAALKILVHIIIGLAIGLMAAAATRESRVATSRPLLLLAQGRLQQLAIAFADVFSAQLRISAINAVLTGIYLLVILPAFGYRVPLAPTLVGFTFFASLIPIVGNLLSNAAITVAALTVSVWLGIASLGFLVVVHKLEYFLNARIVGGRTNVPTYAMLASMLILESAFGLAGLVAAPIFCAWLTRELREGKWV
jgi:predicted PurR-regulated permease PerM